MRWLARTTTALAVLALLATGCSDDGDGGGAAASSTTTTAVDAGASTTAAADDTSSTSADAGGEGAVGSVTVDGETRPLDQITGLLSCEQKDDGSFSVAAESEASTSDGGTFLRLDVYGDDPTSDEFSVAAGETEYVSESPDAIQWELTDQVVTGTVDVVPQFEEGTAQQVNFEVDCGAR